MSICRGRGKSTGDIKAQAVVTDTEEEAAVMLQVGIKYHQTLHTVAVFLDPLEHMASSGALYRSRGCSRYPRRCYRRRNCPAVAFRRAVNMNRAHGFTVSPGVALADQVCCEVVAACKGYYIAVFKNAELRLCADSHSLCQLPIWARTWLQGRLKVTA